MYTVLCFVVQMKKIEKHHLKIQRPITDDTLKGQQIKVVLINNAKSVFI